MADRENDNRLWATPCMDGHGNAAGGLRDKTRGAAAGEKARHPNMLPLVSIIITPGDDAARLCGMIERLEYPHLEIVTLLHGAGGPLGERASLDGGRIPITVVPCAACDASTARNRGVRLARGELVAFLERGHRWPSTSIADRAAPFLEEDSDGLMGCYSPVTLEDANGAVLTDGRLFDHAQPFDRLYFSAVTGTLFNAPCLVFKKRVFEQVGGFRQEAAPAEEQDLWQRMLRTGGYFRKIGSSRVGWLQGTEATTALLRQRNSVAYGAAITRLYTEVAQGPCAPEFRGALSEVLARKAKSGVAMGHAFMAAAAGDMPTAQSMAGQVSRLFFEQIPVDNMLWLLRFNILRALCRKEADWPLPVWPAVAPRILALLRFWEEKFGASQALHALREAVAKLPSLHARTMAACRPTAGAGMR